MKVSLYKAFGAGNAEPVFQSFETGLINSGDKICTNDMDADAVVIWSMLFAGRMSGNEQVYNHYKSQGKPIIVLEVGSLGRNVTWRVGLNHINATGTFPTPDPKYPRWKHFPRDLMPWRNDGEFIVIATQRPDSTQWIGMPPMEQWVEETVHEVRKYSDRPIVIRPHPRDHYTDWDFVNQKIPGMYYDLPKPIGNKDMMNIHDILDRAHIVINHCSNPAVDAIIHGVPVIVGKESLCHELTTTFENIENPNKPDREEWCEKMAYTEWSESEIAAGYPWQYLKKQLV